MTTHGPDCPQEALSAYLDGELDADQRAAIDEHLARCEPCTTLLADLRLLASVTGSEEVPPLPDDLAERIARKLPVPFEPRRRPWIYRMPLAAAAGLAGAALLWVVFQTGPTPLEEGLVQQQPDSGPRSEATVAENQSLSVPLGEDVDDTPRQEAGALDSKPGRAEPSPLENKTKSQQESTFRLDDADDRAAETPTVGKRDESEGAPSAPASQEPMAKEVAADRLGGAENVPIGTPAPAPVAEKVEERRRMAQKKAPAATASGTREQEEPQAPAAAGPELLHAMRDESAGKGREFARQALPGEASPPRTMVLDGPDYQMRLVETGTLTLRAEGYDCTVGSLAIPTEGSAVSGLQRRTITGSLEPEDAELIDTLFESSRFESSDPGSSDPGSSEMDEFDFAPTDDPDEEGPGSYRLTLDGKLDSPQALGETVLSAHQVHALVLKRYRARLEAQCGPLPEGIEPPR